MPHMSYNAKEQAPAGSLYRFYDPGAFFQDVCGCPYPGGCAGGQRYGPGNGVCLPTLDASGQ